MGTEVGWVGQRGLVGLGPRRPRRPIDGCFDLGELVRAEAAQVFEVARFGLGFVEAEGGERVPGWRR